MGGLCGPSHSLLALCCTTHCTTQLSSPLARPPPLPVRAPLPPVSPPCSAPWFYPVVGGCVARQGWGGGGGAPDVGSGPSLREFPHRGADACTPRQGVTLLYGLSICTRSVQMDLRRNQVRRPFPTPGSGTLWVSGESLRDRRVSCLPRWTVCPTRSPSQDTNRSTCRGECSWSGPLATPPGRCHLGPLANGPGHNPPYCLRSGGANTDTGGAPKPLRSGTSPASFAGSCHPAPPPRSLRCWSLPPSFLPQGCPPVPRPLPCFLAPAVSRLPLLSAPALARWCPLFVCFLHLHRSPLVSPPGVSVCPLPPPMSPRCLLAVLAPFLGGWRRRGWGGGASSLPVLWRKHVASTVQARGAALVPLQGGGGLAVWLPSSSYLPCGRTPSVPPLGLARRVLPLGTVVWSVPHPLSAASPPCRFVLGGGSAFRYRHPPPSGGRWCVGGGGGGLSSPLCSTHVAGTTQARRKYGVRHLAAVGGGGGVLLWGPHTPEVGYLTSVSCGPMSPRPPPVRRGIGPCLLAFFPWRVGLLCALLFFFRLHRLPPVSPPGAWVCSLPPPMSPRRLLAVLAPFLGGWGRRGWGGGGASSLSVLWRKHVASTAQARGAALVPLQGGGGRAVWLTSSPFLPSVRTPGAPPAGACTARASYGHGRVVRPAPSLRCLPTLPLCPRGGGGRCPPLPTFIPRPWGAEACGGGGGGLVVFPSLHACRRHDASTAQARGAAPVPLHGGGMPCVSRRRPFYPAFAPPVVPPLGLARRVLSTGTVVWSVPHPLAAASPPCRFVLGGGAAFRPPLPAFCGAWDEVTIPLQ